MPEDEWMCGKKQLGGLVILLISVKEHGFNSYGLYDERMGDLLVHFSSLLLMLDFCNRNFKLKDLRKKPEYN